MGKRIIVEDNASPSAKIVKKTNNQKSNKLIEAKKVETGIFGVSLVASLPDSPSVRLCRLEGTVSPTGDNAWMMAVLGGSSRTQSIPSGFMLSLPLYRWAVDVLPAVLSGGVNIYLYYKGTRRTGPDAFSVHTDSHQGASKQEEFPTLWEIHLQIPRVHFHQIAYRICFLFSGVVLCIIKFFTIIYRCEQVIDPN